MITLKHTFWYIRQIHQHLKGYFARCRLSHIQDAAEMPDGFQNEIAQ